MSSVPTYAPPSSLATQVSRAVDRCLREKGISRTELAARIGWDQSYLNKKLNGKAGDLHCLTIDEIMRALGIEDIVELFQKYGN
jgi:DNA-binding Xre family transcriptional regulator